MICVFKCDPSLVIKERPCNRCNQTLPIKHFPTWRTKDGAIMVKSYCGKCFNEAAAINHALHREERNKRARERFYKKTPEQIAVIRLNAKSHPQSKSYAAEYRKKNRDKVNGYFAAYRKRKRADPEWMKRQAALARKARIESINIRIKNNCRVRIRAALIRTSNKKSLRLNQLTGCQDSLLPFYVLNGLTYKNGFHIDHYVPCSHFDLSNESEQRVCFNWRNLRVISARDNMSKWATLPDNYREVETGIRMALSLDSASL